jgi:hypothetical protein
MKRYLFLVVIVFAFSCDESTREKTTAPLPAAESDTATVKQQEEKIPRTKNEPPESVALKKEFIRWQRDEIQAGRFWAKDSCFMSWFADHDYPASVMPWGFPDLSEMKFSYADVNGDSLVDQLVAFTPDQCDGGNASMWTKFAILTVSGNGKYITKSLDIEGLYFPGGQGDEGFYHYDSIGTGVIYGTHYVFGKDDGHCCPGVHDFVVFDFKTRKLLQVRKKREPLY